MLHKRPPYTEHTVRMPRRYRIHTLHKDRNLHTTIHNHCICSNPDTDHNFRKAHRFHSIPDIPSLRYKNRNCYILHTSYPVHIPYKSRCSYRRSLCSLHTCSIRCTVPYCCSFRMNHGTPGIPYSHCNRHKYRSSYKIHRHRIHCTFHRTPHRWLHSLHTSDSHYTDSCFHIPYKSAGSRGTPFHHCIPSRNCSLSTIRPNHIPRTFHHSFHKWLYSLHTRSRSGTALLFHTTDSFHGIQDMWSRCYIRSMCHIPGRSHRRNSGTSGHIHRKCPYIPGKAGSLHTAALLHIPYMYRGTPDTPTRHYSFHTGCNCYTSNPVRIPSKSARSPHRVSRNPHKYDKSRTVLFLRTNYSSHDTMGRRYPHYK